MKKIGDEQTQNMRDANIYFQLNAWLVRRLKRTAHTHTYAARVSRENEQHITFYMRSTWKAKTNKNKNAKKQ